MPTLRIYSAAEQVAAHLRTELACGTWTTHMPGGAALAQELGIGRMTADAALEILEKEGLLQSQGAGKRRRIADPNTHVQTAMRVALLLYEPEDAANRHIYELRQQFASSGHYLSFAPKSQVELKHNPKRVARMVKDYPADAWIVMAGSKPLLRWFSELPIPAFALFGRMQNLPIAGTRPNKDLAMKQLIQQLADLGHRRIIFLVREERRKPFYGRQEENFLEELENRGIKTGSYNIPDWEESSAGLRECLDKLFKLTPPTAILIDDGLLFLPIQNYFAQKNIRDRKIPALICTDYNPSFNWCEPAIPHIFWDHRSTTRRIVRWVDHVACGKTDIRQSFTRTTFIEGNLRDSAPRAQHEDR